MHRHPHGSGARPDRRDVAASGQDRPARILSLGSGPAREIETFLEEPSHDRARVEFTLIDQEAQALRLCL